MRLKKILSAVLAAALVATCVAVPGTKAMAADTKIMYADTPEGEGYTVRTIGHWIDPSIGSAKVITNRAYMGGTTDSLEAYTAGHKGVGNSGEYDKGDDNNPTPPMTKAQAQIIFEFNVETAGTYTVNFYYASQFKNASTPRTFAYMVNAGDDDEWAADLQYHEYLIYDSITKDDAKPVVDDLKAKGIVGEGGVCSESSAYDNAGWFKIVKETATITLKAGQNKIAICNVDGYDDRELKGINFYAVEYTLKQAAAPAAVTVGEAVVAGNLVSEEDKATLKDGVQENKNMTLDGTTVANTCVGLKPMNDHSQFNVTVNVENAGKYDLQVVYNANTKNGTKRGMSVKVNGGTATDYMLDGTNVNDDDYETCGVKTITVTLNAGVNTITFSEHSKYSTDSVKAPNLATLKLTAAQSSDQGGQTPQNPQTGVATVVIPVAAVMVASGVAAVKSSKKKDEE